ARATSGLRSGCSLRHAAGTLHLSHRERSAHEVRRVRGYKLLSQEPPHPDPLPNGEREPAVPYRKVCDPKTKCPARGRAFAFQRCEKTYSAASIGAGASLARPFSSRISVSFCCTWRENTNSGGRCLDRSM